jgi:acetylornithine/succinyldiaminopimelate/putrescine aminotransferase
MSKEDAVDTCKLGQRSLFEITGSLFHLKGGQFKMTNKDIAAKGQQYVMNTYGRFPIAPVKGKGTYVWDADGKEYLDFLGGIAVDVLGHCDDRLQKTLQEQAAKLWHISNLYWIQPQAELAEKLVKVSGLGKAFFCNSGAEANEAAIKLVRKYFYRKKQDRYEIIVFNHSFHGRTLGTVKATGQKKYQEGFAPLPEGFVYADYNDLSSVEKLINEKTAAIMLEPIQGEGGIHPADPLFLRNLRRICNREGILLFPERFHKQLPEIYSSVSLLKMIIFSNIKL